MDNIVMFMLISGRMVIGRVAMQSMDGLINEGDEPPRIQGQAFVLENPYYVGFQNKPSGQTELQAMPVVIFGNGSSKVAFERQAVAMWFDPADGGMDKRWYEMATGLQVQEKPGIVLPN